MNEEVRGERDTHGRMLLKLQTNQHYIEYMVKYTHWAYIQTQEKRKEKSIIQRECVCVCLFCTC